MYQLIASNKRRSILLIAGFVLVLALVGAAFGLVFGYGLAGTLIALVVSGAIAFASYWKADAVALAVSRARPADPEQYRRLYNLVEGLTIASGLPMPRLYIIEDVAPNAFATGRNPRHAAIAVTTGLLEKMNRVELEGVLAHELSHVKNYDILVSTLAVTLVGAVALLADIGLRMMWWNGGRVRRSGDRDDGNNPLAYIGLIFLFLAPLLGRLMQAAVSRRREALADASAVQMTRYPPGLISALEKLLEDTTVTHSASKATAHLWIEQPMSGVGDEGRFGALNRMFDTHPPLEERIAALRELEDLRMTLTPTARTPNKAVRRLLALTTVGVLLAACGGGKDGASTTTPTTAIGTTVVVAPSSTTTTATTSTTIATTTTAKPVAVAPLTGLPVKDPRVLVRPALVVKIDNHKDARPQAGLNQADIVYEELVEAQITRFFTIFHSQDAAPVGPIRSARTTDVNLLNQLNRPLFTWSGGNPGVVTEIAQANAESRAYGQAPGFYRDQERHRRTAIEHTLMNQSTRDIYATATKTEGPPPKLFQYRAQGAPSTVGSPVHTIDVNMRSVPVHWQWEPTLKVWVRSEYGAPHLDASGAPVTAQNIVFQFVPYGLSPADVWSPDANTVGQGNAFVFTDGKVILGHWSRPQPSKPAVFTDAEGHPILLTPGRTWVELPEAGVTQVNFAA